VDRFKVGAVFVSVELPKASTSAVYGLEPRHGSHHRGNREGGCDRIVQGLEGHSSSNTHLKVEEAGRGFPAPLQGLNQEYERW
jgi:hypothetical protein